MKLCEAAGLCTWLLRWQVPTAQRPQPPQHVPGMTWLPPLLYAGHYAQGATALCGSQDRQRLVTDTAVAGSIPVQIAEKEIPLMRFASHGSAHNSHIHDSKPRPAESTLMRLGKFPLESHFVIRTKSKAYTQSLKNPRNRAPRRAGARMRTRPQAYSLPWATIGGCFQVWSIRHLFKGTGVLHLVGATAPLCP